MEVIPSDSSGHAVMCNGACQLKNSAPSHTGPCPVSDCVEALKRTHPVFAIGDRVRSTEGFTGTVRYIGFLVLGAQGGPQLTGEPPGVQKEDIWIGIQWDDPLQGRHDGCVNGIRYFCCCCCHLSQHGQQQPSAACSHSSTGASFVRPHKLHKPMTFRDAILVRYTAKLTAGKNSEEHPAADLFALLIESHCFLIPFCSFLTKDGLVRPPPLPHPPLPLRSSQWRIGVFSCCIFLFVDRRSGGHACRRR